MNKNLVILRCGKSSLHPHWLSGATERNWDLVLCPFQDILPEPSSVIPPRKIEGQKWTGIYALLTDWQGWRDYEYIWLPDDDLLTNANTINALFEMSKAFDTKISAPALSEDSFYSHPTTMTNRTFFARAVTFIEIMMPCLRRDVLELVLSTIGETKTGFGWGLDFLWPHMIDYQDMVIFDHLTVRHTRPVGTLRDKVVDDLTKQEMKAITKVVRAPGGFRTIGVYDENRKFKYANNGPFLLDYLNGYRYLIAKDNRLFDRLIISQKMSPLEFITYFRKLWPGTNLALNKPALVSSVSRWSQSQNHEDEAKGGNNGNITGECGFHTSLERDPWWQVNLEQNFAIKNVVVFNRMDLRQRCTRMNVSSSEDGENWSIRGAKLDDALFGGADGSPYVFSFEVPFYAQFIRITRIGDGFLHLDEIEVYGYEISS